MPACKRASRTGETLTRLRATQAAMDDAAPETKPKLASKKAIPKAGMDGATD